MTPARHQQSRLARILAIRKAALRAAEVGFAAASARATAAHSRASTVQALIATSGSACGATPLATLRSGASLRALLRPALEAATDRTRLESQSRQSAANRLAGAGARHDRTQRDFASAQSTADRESEERESADRPPRRRP